ncbi:MAG: hypothetical protein PHR45_06705 [Muribaculaceae bacterium]|nr:hypothetical protein [Muribaculaceae bacterium]
MKKIILALAICCNSLAFAQIVDVSSTKEIKLPQGVEGGYYTISPNGDFLLFSDFGHNGLQKLDLTTNQITTVTTAVGAGYNPIITDNGNTIVYRETTLTKDKLRLNSLKSKNLVSGQENVLVTPTRDLQGIVAKDNSVYVVNNSKFATKALSSNSKINKATPVPSIKNGQLMMTIKGKTKVFSPNGTNVRYLWPSVSPDGSKIVYCVSGLGTFVSDINGENIKSLGILRAPKWYNNENVVGMRDVDGEYTTIASSIIIKNINSSEEQILTTDSVIAMYPTVSSTGDKLLFSTPEGKAYLINLNVKK